MNNNEPIPEERAGREPTFAELSKGFEELFKTAEAIELADLRGERQEDWNLRHYPVLARPSVILSLRDIIKAITAERGNGER